MRPGKRPRHRRSLGAIGKARTSANSRASPTQGGDVVRLGRAVEVRDPQLIESARAPLQRETQMGGQALLAEHRGFAPGRNSSRQGESEFNRHRRCDP